MNNKFCMKLLAAGIAAGLVVEAAPVLAQQQNQLEEIVVTARKREESILKVPVTVSVLSGKTLEQYAINDVTGISERTPGLDVGDGPLSSGTLVSLRGVGTGTNNPNIDQSVALVTDGMQFTQGLAYKASTFDMAQVEVLKGPQALFFGKAAPAGVIAIRTADPTDEFEVRVRAGYETEAEEKLGEFIISGPVTDTLGLRLATQYSDSEGYFKNTAVPSNVPFLGIPPLGDLGAAPVSQNDVPSNETLMMRGTALWQPVEEFTARLKLNYSDVDTKGTGGEPQFTDCPEGNASIFFPFNFITPDCKGDQKMQFSYMDPAYFPLIYNGGKPFTEFNQFFGTLDLNFELGNDLTLASVTGYYDVTQKSMINGSVSTYYGTPFVIQGKLDRTDFTQELRLTSDYDGAINFLIGGFYQDSQTDYLSQLPANQLYNTLISIIRPGSQLLPPLLAWADHDVEGKTYSAFGQVLWDITPELELGVGARYTHEDRKQSTNDLLYTAFGLPAHQVNLANPNLGSDRWSPEASLTYTPTDELTIYGNLKQAYKSGGFDVGGAAADGDDKSFKDERVRGGELGIKSRLVDGNLLLNASTYYYKYDDMQVAASVFDPITGNVGVYTTNAASSEIYGIDFDMTFSVPQVEGLILYGGVNWNHATYDNYGDADCWLGQTQAMGCNIDQNGDGIGDAQDLTDDDLLRAPRWTGNVGFDYETPVFDGMLLQLGSFVSYSDNFYTDTKNFSGSVQKSYFKTNASIGLTTPDNHWKVEVIGDNITDEYTTGKCTPAGYVNTLLFGQDPTIAGTGTVNGGPQGLPASGCNMDRGRSVWLRVTWNM